MFALVELIRRVFDVLVEETFLCQIVEGFVHLVDAENLLLLFEYQALVVVFHLVYLEVQLGHWWLVGVGSATPFWILEVILDLNQHLPNTIIVLYLRYVSVTRLGLHQSLR